MADCWALARSLCGSTLPAAQPSWQPRRHALAWSLLCAWGALANVARVRRLLGRRWVGHASAQVGADLSQLQSELCPSRAQLTRHLRRESDAGRAAAKRMVAAAFERAVATQGIGLAEVHSLAWPTGHVW